MATDAQRNLKTRKILFVILLALICIVLVYAAFQKDRPWVVPEEVKKLKNPIAPTESTLKAARGIYTEECAQCHGKQGNGHGPKAKLQLPAPADLTDARRIKTITDGAIFYQINEGPN